MRPGRDPSPRWGDRELVLVLGAAVAILAVALVALAMALVGGSG